MDFDQHARSYRDDVRSSISFAAADSDLVLEVKADQIVALAKRHGLDPATARFLDIGCGIGLIEKLIGDRVGSIAGVDISAESIAQARAANPSVPYTLYDGERLPFDDGAFDVCFAVCVMHHVPPDRWQAFLAEARRVTRHGGLVLVFEHNPINPLTRRVVSQCVFDADAVLLSHWRTQRLGRRVGLELVEQRSILYFPWRGRWFRALERVLGRVPFGGQYYCAFRSR